MATKRFWRYNEDAPFATLLSVVDGHCHPEAGEWAYTELQRLAKDDTSEVMRKFKAELREVMGDPSKLPPGALSTAAEYDDGTDEAFLRRLWRDLYGDEPV
jgi:hypothetical protein